MNLNEKDVQQVTDYFSLMRLLSEKLDWEINPEAVQDDGISPRRQHQITIL